MNIEIRKNGEYYIFRYEHGEENLILTDLIEKAQNPLHPFDWFDAAVVAHQMSCENKLIQIAKKKGII